MTGVVIVIYLYFQFHYALASSNVLKTIGRERQTFSTAACLLCATSFLRHPVSSRDIEEN